jgi:hypothetical protein
MQQADEALDRWLASQPVDLLEAAEAAHNTTTPTRLLRVVRMRPAFEPSIRLVIVDVLRLPGSERWAAA